MQVVAGTTAEGLHTCLEYTRQRKASRRRGGDDQSASHGETQFGSGGAAFRGGRRTTVDIEIVVQDYPPISGFAMEPALLARIAREIPRARTIKLEDPPTPFKTSRILEASKDMPVRIFGGLGGVFLLEELMAGATGAMTGFAYPEILVDIVSAFRAGDVDRAADVFYRTVPLMRFEFQEGIGMAIRKEVLRRRGALKSAAIRAPGAKLDAATLAALDRVLNWTEKDRSERWISA